MKGKINFPVIIIMDGHIISYRKNWKKLSTCGVNDLDRNFSDALLIDSDGRSFTIKHAVVENSNKQLSFLNKIRNKEIQVKFSFKRKIEEIGFDDLKSSLITRLNNDDLMIDEDFWEKDVMEKIEKADSYKKLFKAFRKKIK